MSVVPVILSGGAGSRLWPVSREAHPKPFMHMPDGESLLEKTLKRVLEIPNVKKVLTITNRDYYFQTVDEYQKISPADNISLDYLLEPVGRNTAPAILSAALSIIESDSEDAVMLVLPADHLISPITSFVNRVEKAVTLAQNKRLVTFGIKPTKAETGYGYIKKGQTALGESCYAVDEFTEKPNQATAQIFIDSGSYVWNAGMFCFSPETLIEEFEKHNSELLAQVRESWQHKEISQSKSSQVTTLAKESFSKVASISIDYAIMEKSNQVSVVECDFNWNDVGSWDSISQQLESDEKGNYTDNQNILLDSENTCIRGSDRLIAGIGLKNIMIVDTPDALLVTNKDNAQEVKRVVETLKAIKHEAYKFHNTVHRPWGTYTVLEEGERFKLKRIVVKPGAILSLQSHHHRSEHWIVVSGTAVTIIGDEKKTVNINESTFVPIGVKHRLINPGVVDLVMIEVQSGEYLGEDDIVRYDDEYGRDVK